MSERDDQRADAPKEHPSEELSSPETPRVRARSVEVVLSLPDPDELYDDEEDAIFGPQSLVTSALTAIERLDPVAKPKGENASGDRLLPGRMPLAPITFSATILNTLSMVSAFFYSSVFAPTYLMAFAIAHTVYFAHLWGYHVGYYSQKRFLVFKRASFILLFAAFMDWMLYDLILNPPIKNADPSWLQVAFFSNAFAALLILSHWIYLGKGHRIRRGEKKNE